MAKSLAHSKWLCKYHIVFSPKYRRKIVYYQLRADIQKIIKDLCKWKGLERHMIPDHIHLFINSSKVQCTPNRGVSKGKKHKDALRKTCKFKV